MIRFVQMDTGKWEPVDAQPSELNGQILVQRGTGTLLGRAAAQRAIDEGYDLYVSHFRTCPGGKAQSTERNALEPGPRERARARQAFARRKSKHPQQGTLL